MSPLLRLTFLLGASWPLGLAAPACAMDAKIQAAITLCEQYHADPKQIREQAPKWGWQEMPRSNVSNPKITVMTRGSGPTRIMMRLDETSFAENRASIKRLTCSVSGARSDTEITDLTKYLGNAPSSYETSSDLEINKYSDRSYAWRFIITSGKRIFLKPNQSVAQYTDAPEKLTAFTVLINKTKGIVTFYAFYR